MSTFRRFASCRSGNFAVLTAILAVPILGAAGMGITLAQRELLETELQQELDAAVLAGTSPGYRSLDENRLKIAYSLVGYNPKSFIDESDTEISVDASKGFEVNGTNVSGFSTADMPNMFTYFAGSDFLKIHVTAKAEKVASLPICILALNPDEERSIEVYGNASVDAPDCVIMANSTDGEGIKQYGQDSYIHAAGIGVSGSYSGANLTPKPHAEVEPVDDPYFALPVPDSGACIDAENKLSQAEVELQPGTYCGGINISPQSKITMAPGIYIMKDGPLRIGAGSSLQGSEVLIALVGENSILDVSANSSIRLTSPKSGVYANIQFMSDRVAEGKFKGEEWTTISSSEFEFDGVMYLPEHDIWFKGGSQINANSPTLAFVADQLWVQDSSEIRVTNNNDRNVEVAAAHSRYEYGARLVD